MVDLLITKIHRMTVFWTSEHSHWKWLYVRWWRTRVAGERTRRRLDFVVWHQDVVTAAPTIDIEVFRVPHEGLFMATASFDGDDLKKRQSAIFKWEEGRFRLYQSLYTLGAQGWEHFQIGDMVSGHPTRRVWGGVGVGVGERLGREMGGRFRLYQSLYTLGARIGG